jgi:hypothetical protein
MKVRLMLLYLEIEFLIYFVNIVELERDLCKGVAMIFCWGGPDFKPQTDDR